jgi:hypothetical protein
MFWPDLRLNSAIAEGYRSQLLTERVQSEFPDYAPLHPGDTKLAVAWMECNEIREKVLDASRNALRIIQATMKPA